MRLLGKPATIGALAILAWPALYPALLSALARTRKSQPMENHRVDWADLPKVTVLIPAHREERLIEERLANLAECEYPRERLEAIVIDSSSGDRTPEFVRRFATENRSMSVQLIEEPERAGKAAAINRGLKRVADDGLVIVTDAPTRFCADAILRIASVFRDPAVGAATGHFEVTGPEDVIVREEKLFWRVRNLIRRLEAEVDSTPFLSGELCCFRAGLVEALDEDSLADDMNIALKVRRKGYRVAVEERARFSEPRSGSLRELLQTKSRRATGGIQELLRSRDMLFNRRFGLFGLLILPSALAYYLPLRLPALALLSLTSAKVIARGPLRVASAALLGVALARLFGLQLAMMFFNEFIFALGWWRLLSKRTDVRWVQERTTREAA